MARLSGLQREVLSLYRKCLRAIRHKPQVGYFFFPPLPLRSPADRSRRNQEAISKTMHAEFQKHLSVNKKDFGAVEYLLRKGHRQLEMYASPGIRNIR
ncbi:Complex 1 LYR protein [Penicillium atrosanguineum]|nr:Complex 1 LYR protein [Penicillium atrosanguineum]